VTDHDSACHAIALRDEPLVAGASTDHGADVVQRLARERGQDPLVVRPRRMFPGARRGPFLGMTIALALYPFDEPRRDSDRSMP
jgi:hypothetical protein